ncbi:MAG TPA: nicotinamide riboside transporter PnuC [Thermoanaerobaculia bacterium]|nr:nicotinamide riboside transporter PnuC [Thermoanaerobaculia bacterium]
MTWLWTAIELGAVLFTLVNVWLAVKENMWTWPTGIVAVLLTFVLYLHQLIYLNAWLQIVYFVLSIHGWYEWLHGGVNKTERRISYASGRTWLVTMPAGLLLTAALFYLERRFAPAGSLPFWDALTTAFSIVGQYMLNMKIIENWIIWAIVDVMYVFMLIDQHLYYLAALNAFLFILCIKGFIDWRRTERSHASAS